MLDLKNNAKSATKLLKKFFLQLCSFTSPNRIAPDASGNKPVKKHSNQCWIKFMEALMHRKNETPLQILKFLQKINFHLKILCSSITNTGTKLQNL